MKIKSVEISAFRIYDNPQEATFDFTDKQGEIANFVGLYAPNGFGKTSFYDAVEWGITNSIQRFYIRNTEMDILAHSQSSYNDISLLKNSNSSRDTFVKIVMDTEEKEQTLPKKRNQKSDLNFRQPKVHDFQQVILSQEWISAFLTEKNGVERLKKFMEKPDLAPIYSYFRKLIVQIGVLKTKKEKIQEDIGKYQTQFINDTQDDLLDKINLQIALLVSNFNQTNLFPIQLSTTREEIKKLRDIITENLSSQNKLFEIQSKLNDLVIAKSGSKEIIGLDLFFKYKSTLRELSTRLSEISDRIKQFDDLDKKNNSLFQLKSTLGSLQNQKQECDVIIDIFEDYKEINDDILKRKAEISTNEELIKPIQAQVLAFNQEEVDLNVQLESVSNQIYELSNNIAIFPSIKERINSHNDKIINLKESISSFPEGKIEIEENLNQLRRKINDIQESIDNIAIQKYSIQSVTDIPTVELINVIESKNKKLTSKEEVLLVLNEKIDSQNQLNLSLQEFVEIGLKLATDRQSSLCPLCEHDYGTYIELAQKISKNTGLTKLLQDLLREKSELLSEINTLENEISESNKILTTFYNQLKDESLQLIKLQEEKLSQLTNANKDKTYELQQQEELLSELTKFLDGNDINEFENILTKKIDDLTKSKETLSEKLTNVRLSIIEYNDNKSTILNKIVLYKNEIEALEQNEKYKKVINWFNSALLTQNIDQEFLNSKNKELHNQIESSISQIKFVENEILQLSKNLAELDLENLKMQINENEKKQIELQQSVGYYRNFLIERIEINPDNYDEFSTLLVILEQKNNEVVSTLETNRKLIQEYEKLQSYSVNIEGFLQSEDAKMKFNKLNEDLNFLANNVEPLLQEEKENTKNYLNERIKDFFYEKLINELYRKIDPHPDFKSVQFQPDFENDTPRLDVFVKNSTDETMLIPNLYFSTAQINILSLSIFLASALNSEKYDCIFIDDPIQSMDSINVLSTIDLLRSIALSYDKQIILSTHDENFHNLLKKKMPPDLYKSKFLELESFGKLKASNLE